MATLVVAACIDSIYIYIYMAALVVAACNDSIYMYMATLVVAACIDSKSPAHKLTGKLLSTYNQYFIKTIGKPWNVSICSTRDNIQMLTVSDGLPLMLIFPEH